MPYLESRRTTYRIGFRLHGSPVRLSSGTSDLATATAYEATVRRCLDEGYHDVVGLVVGGRVPLSLLHEEVTLRGMQGLRARLERHLAQVDLLPLIEVWEREALRRGTPSADTVKHYVALLRSLTIGRGSLVPDDLTPGWVAGRLAEIKNPVKALVALRQWCQWLRGRGLLAGDPTDLVPRPKVGGPRERFLDEAGVKRLMLAAPEPWRSAIALAHGTGIEASVLVALTGADVNPVTRCIRARGTKTRSRDRWVRCADYVWPVVERLLAERGQGPLFPGMTRWALSEAHRTAAQHIGEHGLRLHDARHSFAVRLVRAGVPFAVVAAQLGHANALMVIKVYGRYAPQNEELDRWERVASQAAG